MSDWGPWLAGREKAWYPWCIGGQFRRLMKDLCDQVRPAWFGRAVPACSAGRSQLLVIVAQFLRSIKLYRWRTARIHRRHGGGQLGSFDHDDLARFADRLSAVGR